MWQEDIIQDGKVHVWNVRSGGSNGQLACLAEEFSNTSLCQMQKDPYVRSSRNDNISLFFFMWNMYFQPFSSMLQPVFNISRVRRDTSGPLGNYDSQDIDHHMHLSRAAGKLGIFAGSSNVGWNDVLCGYPKSHQSRIIVPLFRRLPHRCNADSDAGADMQVLVD